MYLPLSSLAIRESAKSRLPVKGDFNQLSQVSSLYGIGSVLCWLLGIVSIMLTWTLHLRKRKSGSLDADFIACMAYPIMAAAQLISKIHQLPFPPKNLLTSTDPDVLKLVAAIEAPLNLTETAMALCVILFLICAWKIHVRRAFIVALTGIICLSAEVYVRLTVEGINELPGHFYRHYMVHFDWTLLTAVSIIGFLTIFTTIFLPRSLSFQRLPPSNAPVLTSNGQDNSNISHGSTTMGQAPDIHTHDRIVNEHLRIAIEMKRQADSILVITRLSFILLPVSFVVSLVGISTDIFWINRSSKNFLLRFAENALPRSNSSIKNLDQLLALLTGLITFCFALYGAIHSRTTSDEAESIETRSTYELDALNDQQRSMPAAVQQITIEDGHGTGRRASI